MFKFELNQIVFFLYKEKILQAKVVKRLFVDGYAPEQDRDDFKNFGPSREQYLIKFSQQGYTVISVEERPAEKLFATKEDLIVSLG